APERELARLAVCGVVVSLARELGEGDRLKVERCDQLAHRRNTGRSPEGVLLAQKQRRAREKARQVTQRRPARGTCAPSVFYFSHSEVRSSYRKIRGKRKFRSPR